MGKIYEIEPSNEYFDVTVSYAVENIIHTEKDWQYYAPLDDAIISSGGIFYEDANLFIEKCDEMTRFEIEKNAATIYSNRLYLGSWSFILADDEGAPLDGELPVIGNIYLLNISQNLNNKMNGFNDKIKIVDIVFMGVNKNLIGNLLDNAQHRLLSLNGDDRRLQDLLLEVFSLHIISAPKSIVASCSSTPFMPDTREIVAVMGHQTLETKLTNCPQSSTWLRELSKTNYSDFENFYITISNCNIIQQYCINGATKNTLAPLPKEYLTVDTRLGDLVLSIFIVDILLVKAGLLRLIQRKLDKELDKEILTTQDLLLTNLQITQLNNLWYARTYIYPITEEMARKIEKSFNLDDMKRELMVSQQSFERLSNMQITFHEKNADKKAQDLFRLFTILSALSTTLALINVFFPQLKMLFKVMIFFTCLIMFITLIYAIPHYFKRSKPKDDKKKKRTRTQNSKEDKSN